MSKVSNKQRYMQLVSWLDSRPKKQGDKKQESKSRMNYYDSKGFNSGRDSGQGNRRR